MFPSRTSRTLASILIFLPMLTLSACGGDGDSGTDGQPTDLDEAIRIVDEHVCTDEREQAIEYATFSDYETAVPDLWDGTPYVVDVSSSFSNANELLDALAEEAELIHVVLGYEIFVSGNVLPLADLEDRQLWENVNVASRLVPPDQHIEIRCCYGEDSSSAGTAYAWWRIILLENDEFQSRHIIIHELYHILGLGHPGNPPSIVMSDSMMRGPGHNQFGASLPTTPDAYDLAKLACIYDQSEWQREDMTAAFGVNDE